LNYDRPQYDPFTTGNYTFYRARDVNASPMFRPLEYDTVYPQSWSFTRYDTDKFTQDRFWKVPICRN